MRCFMLSVLMAYVLCVGCSKNGDSVAQPNDAFDATDRTSSTADAGETIRESVAVSVENGVARLSAENTRIQFVGTHVGDMPNPRTGGFSTLSGQLKFDEEGQKLESITLEVPTDSLWTTLPPLTAHLKSPDFFDVRQYPTMTFTSTAITSDAAAPNHYEVVGDLTLLATTKPIAFSATVVTGRGEVAVRSEFTIDRTEFGMSFGLDQVEKEVSLTVIVGERSTEGPPMTAMAGAVPPPGRTDFKAMFEQRDADGDGKLTGEEIYEGMRQNLAQVDKDGDGAVSLQEFVQRMREREVQGFTPTPPPVEESPKE